MSPSPPAGPWIAAARPWSEPKWLAQHDAFVARARQGGIDVLFLGDSITENFATRGAEVWDREIAPLGNVVDFGIGGDRTQFVLWRAQHGELAGSGARVVVLMIGTNNLSTATPANVARGVAAIVGTIRATLPDAVVVLNAVLPRGDRDDLGDEAGRGERTTRRAGRRQARALARRGTRVRGRRRRGAARAHARQAAPLGGGLRGLGGRLAARIARRAFEIAPRQPQQRPFDVGIGD